MIVAQIEETLANGSKRWLLKDEAASFVARLVPMPGRKGNYFLHAFDRRLRNTLESRPIPVGTVDYLAARVSAILQAR